MSVTNQQRDYINETSQAERRATLDNDRRASTYLSHVHDADEMGGRYKAVHTQTVIGKQEQIQYPKGADWCCESAGVEPPLNYRIDDMEPCGEYAEVAASLNALGDVAASPFPATSTKGGASSDRLSSLKGAAHFKRRI
jgi:hypothetical protein